MSGFARVGDPVSGGNHCHGHPHDPPPAPGFITTGSPKVYIEGRAAARVGDQGQCTCCGGTGTIAIESSQEKVIISGQAAAVQGSPTRHCGEGEGRIAQGSVKVVFGEGSARRSG